MALTAEQRRIAKRIVQVGKRQGASRKQIKAALAAGQVESGLRNLSGGDRDSVGVFQIRSGIHGPIGGSVEKSARWFFKNAKSADKGQSSGRLAQDVERSAFPAKYSQRGVQRTAGQLLRQFGKSGGKARSGTRTVTQTIPGNDQSIDRTLETLSYFRQKKGLRPIAGTKSSRSVSELMGTLSDLKDTPARTTRTKIPTGKKAKATVSRTKDPRKGGLVQFGRQLQKQGVSVREHPAFDKVDPVHVQGSEHYKRRAIDIPVKNKAQGDRIARRARKRGFDVIWQEPGHYGHVHASKPGGLR